MLLVHSCVIDLYDLLECISLFARCCSLQAGTRLLYTRYTYIYIYIRIDLCLLYIYIMLTFAQQSGITCNTLDSMLPIPLYLPEAFEKCIYAVHEHGKAVLKLSTLCTTQ